MKRISRSTLNTLFSVLFILSTITSLSAEHSVARQWNEVLLEAIRGDFARPTVHARNLFHTSVVMYDAWAVYDDKAETYLLGKNVQNYQGCPFEGIAMPDDREAARKEAISYAAYRLLKYRFRSTPAGLETIFRFDSLFLDLGYDVANISTDYTTGSPAALGNYIAECMINYGLQDYSNEENGYANLFYQPVNGPIAPAVPGNPDIMDPNRWQAISLEVFIDQSGQFVDGETQPFLSPEWGSVLPFALTSDDLTIHQREGFDYWVYHDPGAPPYIDINGGGDTDLYRWGFMLVGIWSAHLDPYDGVNWDISPGALGNIPIEEFPRSFEDYDKFYDLLDGGDPGTGHSVNPKTGQPYEPNIVPRGDYARVLAEFWADGPDSETPPGHWYTILNYVSDHPEIVKKFRGEGEELNDLEWDIKSYFTLGGAMHDAAISAWGIKGWYDYLRPVSALRYMADLGQSSDPNKPSYHPAGLPLIPGLIELIEEGDPLAGSVGHHIGKLKIFGWKGPNFIEDPETDEAGVDWIRVESWWPYQRPTFVTPPFAGYVSGHSTYSRAAAEVMTFFTGDEFFPGGVGEFVAKKNEFLVFEEGPSVDVVLQWATYRDASDQTSLSRIWGGIHPPADDIPGRLIGEQIGIDAFDLAVQYFEGEVEDPPFFPTEGDPVPKIYPNPVSTGAGLIDIVFDRPVNGLFVELFNAQGQIVRRNDSQSQKPRQDYQVDCTGLPIGIYMLRLTGDGWDTTSKVYIH